MINQHLRIATYNNPLAKLVNLPENSYGLMEKALLEWLVQALNFTYEIIVPTDVQQLGIPLENGTWTGVLGILVRGVVNILSRFCQQTLTSLYLFGPATLSRSKVVDQSFPVIADNLGIMIPYPKIKNYWNLSASASSTTVIFSIVSTVLLVVISLWLVYCFKRIGNLNISELVVFVVGVTLSQGGYIRPNSSAFRLIHGTWLLALLFLMNVYSGTLTSLFMNAQYDFLVRSVEELAADEKIMPMIVKGSPAHGDLFASSSPMIQKIVTRIQQNQEKLLRPSTGNFVDVMLKEPHLAFLLSDIVQGYEIQQDVKKMGCCRAITLDKVISTRNNCISLRKNSPHTPIFNRMILLLRQSGLIQRLEKTYRLTSGRCSLDEDLLASNIHLTQIKFSQIQVVFIILLIGNLICFVVFLGELWITISQK